MSFLQRCLHSTARLVPNLAAVAMPPFQSWSNLFYAERVRINSKCPTRSENGRLVAITEMDKDDPRWLVFDHDDHFLGAVEGEPDLSWELDLSHCHAYQPLNRLLKNGMDNPSRVTNTKRHSICKNKTVPAAVRRRLTAEWLFWEIPVAHRR